MAKHQRQIVREAVVAALYNKTAAQHRVEAMRFVTYTNLQLPAIGVYVTEESVDPESKNTAPRWLSRSTQLTIEAVIKYEWDKVENDLDAISREIEAAMDVDPTFGAVAADSILSRTDLAIIEEGERTVGVARLAYAFEYGTESPTTLPTLDDLKTVDVKTSLGGTQAAADQKEIKVENLDT